MTQLWRSPSKPWDQCSAERKHQLYQAWSTGNLRWKLDPAQQAVYDQIYASHKTTTTSFKRQFFMDIARQFGKDFLLSTLGIETCFRHRRMIRVAYAAPTKDMVHRAIRPTISAIFQDCPPDLLPAEIASGTFLTNARSLTWPWGAKIDLVGVDLHPEWLRGPATFAILFTEAAFVESLDAIMQNVILPQLITQPDGFVVFGSTPPDSPGHVWSREYIPKAMQRGMYAKRTIMDCARITDEHREALIEEVGGRKSTRCRRELFCEHVVETELAAVPEYQEVRDKILTDEGFDPPPEYRDTYVAIDPGFSHATGAVFGYPDFRTGLFMVEGDLCMQYANSREVARGIQAREWQLWGFAPRKPHAFTEKAWREELEAIRALFYPDLKQAKPVKTYLNSQVQSRVFRRHSDVDNRVIADMASEHGLVISPTEKDNADAALNSLRLNLQRLKYRIHPRCVFLDAHLSQAVWNKSRTKLAETSTGHYDTIPAMVYLNRNLLWSRNPNPPIVADPRNTFSPTPVKATGTAAALSKAFRRAGR